MTRIIAGVARGRRLSVPGRGTRPTADRVRESLFSSLDSELSAAGIPWNSVAVLDLYAGSGALGLEALSRGARAAWLVEGDRSAMKTLRSNCEAVGMPGALALGRRVEALAGEPPTASGANLVFADPPYDVPAPQVAQELQRLAGLGWIADDARVVVERPTRDGQTPLPESWGSDRERTFGDTRLWYGRARPHGDHVDDPDPAREEAP